MWDFNLTTFELKVKVPNFVRNMLETMLDKFNVPYIAHELFHDFTLYSFSEHRLSFMNDKHAFSTTWEFSVEGLSCALYQEQEEYDLLPEQLKVNRARPSDEACRFALEYDDMYGF